MPNQSLSLPFAYVNTTGGPVDEYYYFRSGPGAYIPYTSRQHAIDNVPVESRSGRTVNIQGVDWWWLFSDTSAAGLILKVYGSATGGDTVTAVNLDQNNILHVVTDKGQYTADLSVLAGAGGAVSAFTFNNGKLTITTTDGPLVADISSVLDRTNHTGVQVIATVTGLQAALDGKAAVNHSHLTGTAAAPGFSTNVYADLTGKPSIPSIAGLATVTYVDQQIGLAKQRENHSGVQPAATISDLVEVVQDIVAALITTAGSLTKVYDDANNSLVLSVVNAAFDAESARDVIGAALVGQGLITVTVDDAGDKIYIATTATKNSTDAELRDLATHTGLLPVAKVSGLAPVAISGNYNDLTNKPAAGSGIAVSSGFPVSLSNGKTAGALKNGDVIPAGTPYDDLFWQRVLIEQIYPIYTPASQNLTQSAPPVGELGEAVSNTLTDNFSQGDAGSFSSGRIARNGTTIAGSVSTTLPLAVTLTMTRQLAADILQGLVTYGAGPVKIITPAGTADTRPAAVRQSDAPQAAETNFGSNQLNFYGIVPWFFGSADADGTPDIYGGTKVIALSNGQITVPSFGAGTKWLWFAVPHNADDSMQKLFTTWYRTAVDASKIGGSTNLFRSPVTVPVSSRGLASNWTRNFDLYYTNYATAAGTATTLN